MKSTLQRASEDRDTAGRKGMGCIHSSHLFVTLGVVQGDGRGYPGELVSGEESVWGGNTLRAI